MEIYLIYGKNVGYYYKCYPSSVEKFNTEDQVFCPKGDNINTNSSEIWSHGKVMFLLN